MDKIEPSLKEIENEELILSIRSSAQKSLEKIQLMYLSLLFFSVLFT
jgi:hypothetical protein